MKPLIPTLSMQVTYQCNIACRHCGPFCGPLEKDWITLDEMKDLTSQAAELGALSVVFTGGEPTLLKDKLHDILRHIRDETSIRSTRMVTNCTWAKTEEIATKKLRGWQQVGLNELNFSCGEYHQEFVPIEYVANAYRAAVKLGFQTVLLVGEFNKQGTQNWTPQMFHEAVGEELNTPATMSPYVSQVHGMSCGDVMAYGRGAEELSADVVRKRPEAEVNGVCSDVLNAITVHPNGNLTACCGIMVRDESLLNIGNWRKDRLRPLVERAHEDVILNWIRYVGLHDMKAWLKQKDPSLKFKDSYTNICDLCADVVYNTKAQRILVEESEERIPSIVANKVAMDACVGSPDFRYAGEEVSK